MKCKKLTVDNFYPNGDPLIVLGRILSQNSQTLTFITGSGREYTISKSYKHSLIDTKQEFNIKVIQK